MRIGVISGDCCGVHSGVETLGIVSSTNFSISIGFGVGTEKLISSDEFS